MDQLNEKIYQIQENDKTYKAQLRIKNNQLKIKITLLEDQPYVKWSNLYSIEDLKKIDKSFELFENINEVIEHLRDIFEKNDFKININDALNNFLTLSYEEKIRNKKIQCSFLFQSKQMKLKKIINDQKEEIQNKKTQNNTLNEENKELKEQIQKLKCNNLQLTNENIEICQKLEYQKKNNQNMFQIPGNQIYFQLFLQFLIIFLIMQISVVFQQQQSQQSYIHWQNHFQLFDENQNKTQKLQLQEIQKSINNSKSDLVTILNNISDSTTILKSKNEIITTLDQKLNQVNTFQNHHSKSIQLIQDYVSNINIHFTSSNILSSQDFKTISKWINQTNQLKFKIIYRATTHGFQTEKFHERTQNKSPNLVVIKTTENKIFGGYTDQIWKKDYGCISSYKSFIFSLNLNKKYSLNDGSSYCAIQTDNNQFGFYLDIRVYSDSNINKSSSTQFSIYGNKEKSNEIISGETHFQTSEIEVFEVIGE